MVTLSHLAPESRAALTRLTTYEELPAEIREQIADEIAE
jgi:hypothetical protein